MTTRNRVEKLTLNNQIVKMRKDVKRARLWLINDLNHRVKKLTRAKANERDLEKNQRKAEKLRGEIQLLKHIDFDEVSKFALCNKQELHSEFIDENGLDMTQKVMLQLANHKFVQEQVKIFRQIYAVPIDRLILLIRSLGLQYQKKKKKLLLNSTVEENPPNEIKKKKKIVQEKKVSEGQKIVQHLSHSTELGKIPVGECLHNSSSEEDPKLVLNLGIPGKSDEIHDSSSSEIEARVKIGPSHISKPLPGNFRTDVHHNLETLQNGQISTTNPAIVKKEAKRKENLNPKIPWPKLLVPQINKTAGTMIIKQLNLDNEADTISVDESHKTLENIRDSNELPRDSFFLGGVDLSLEDEDETKNDKNHLDSLRVHSRNNFGKRASQNKTFNTSSSNMRELTNGPTRIKPATKTPPVSSPEVLHPSWQAKRKEKELQINIGTCHGKKIRFDSD